MLRNFCNKLLQKKLTSTPPVASSVEVDFEFVKILKRDFASRQRKNELFSLRAYANFLGISPGSLSHVFNGTRALPKRKLDHVASKLGLSPKLKKLFTESSRNFSIKLNIAPKPHEDETLLTEESHFRVIAEWEHYAILSLLNLNDFESDTSWIASRLGITSLRAEVVLEHLERSQLVEWHGDKLRRRLKRVQTSNEIPSSALRQAHKETLQLAAEKIDSVPVDKRGYYSETLALDPKKLPAAKQLIKEFNSKLAKMLESGERHEVYQLGVQLFPLTQETKGERI